jgi:hypothetical protein
MKSNTALLMALGGIFACVIWLVGPCVTLSSGPEPFPERPQEEVGSRIEIVGVHPVDAVEPCHLVEMIIRGCKGKFDISGFTQEAPGRPMSNWQVAYMECLLNADGTAIIADDYEMQHRPELWQGDVWLAFFIHYLDLNRPLRTPFGEVTLPRSTPRPRRLDMIPYEPVD